MGTDSIRHQKRLAAPLSYPIARKPYTFTFHGDSGAHGIHSNAIPLGLILREQLKLVKNVKELKFILNRKNVLVDGKPRTSPKHMVGVNDVLSMPGINAYYRLIPWVGRRKIKVLAIDKKDSTWKLCVIKNKTTISSGHTQLNLDDGRNIIIKKDENPEQYSTKGTLKIEIPSQKILEYYPFELNTAVLIASGTNTGLSGKLQYIEKRIGKNRSIAIVESEDGNKIITAMENIIIVGKNKPEIPVFKPSENSED